MRDRECLFAVPVVADVTLEFLSNRNSMAMALLKITFVIQITVQLIRWTFVNANRSRLHTYENNHAILINCAINLVGKEESQSNRAN